MIYHFQIVIKCNENNSYCMTKVFLKLTKYYDQESLMPTLASETRKHYFRRAPLMRYNWQEHLSDGKSPLKFPPRVIAKFSEDNVDKNYELIIHMTREKLDFQWIHCLISRVNDTHHHLFQRSREMVLSFHK